jgi:putative MATE family efflux protein
MAWPATLSAALFVVMDLFDAAMLGTVGASDMAGAALGATGIALVVAFPAGAVAGLAPLVAALPARALRADLLTLLRIAVATSLLAGAASLLLVLAAMELLPHLGYEPALTRVALSYLAWRAPCIGLEVFLVAGWALLEGTGNTRTPLVAGAVCAGANIGLNALLIPGPWGLPIRGAAGAALSTNLALALGAAVIALGLWRAVARTRGTRSGAASSARRRALLHRFVRVGWPLGLAGAIDVAGWLAFGAVVASLGTVATASHTVWSRLIALGAVFAHGAGAALVTLVARAAGQGRAANAGSVGRWVVRAQATVGVALGLLFVGLGDRWLALFTDDTAVIRSGAGLSALAGAIVLVDGLAIVATRLLEGLTRTRVLFTAAAALDLGLGLPALWLLGSQCGIEGCYVAWALRLLLKLGVLLWQVPRELWLVARASRHAASPLEREPTRGDPNRPRDPLPVASSARRQRRRGTYAVDQARARARDKWGFAWDGPLPSRPRAGARRAGAP